MTRSGSNRSVDRKLSQNLGTPDTSSGAFTLKYMIAKISQELLFPHELREKLERQCVGVREDVPLANLTLVLFQAHFKPSAHLKGDLYKFVPSAFILSFSLSNMVFYI